MQPNSEYEVDLSGFSGSAPVFPLPNVVLFPHVALPLHIFEPRYREMIADALEGERLIAMALLKPGWEELYEEKPAIHEMVCLGRITAEESLEDGKYNIVLTGLTRALVVEEPETELLYRTAKLELFRDFYSKEPLFDPDVRRRELLAKFRKLFPSTRADSLFQQILDAELPLGMLCDLLTAAMRIEPAQKQKFLEELDVDLRSDQLLHTIRQLLPEAARDPRQPFPPEFSVN